ASRGLLEWSTRVRRRVDASESPAGLDQSKGRRGDWMPSGRKACLRLPGLVADLTAGAVRQGRYGARSSMQRGLRGLASGRWASQQSGEQKCSGRRLRLQVETEHLYQTPPQAMGFLQMLQRDQDAAELILGESSSSQGAARLCRTLARNRHGLKGLRPPG